MEEIYARLNGSRPMMKLKELSGPVGSSVTISGLAGATGAFIAASLLDETDRPVLVVMPGPSQAEAMLDDLTGILGPGRVGFLPPLHIHSFDTTPLATGPRNERVEALLRLGSGRPTALVTQPEALILPGPDPIWIERHTRRLTTGDPIARTQLLSELADADYRRESLVDSQGQFAVRGGLVDIFPYGHENPIRIEFDGDDIVSLRRFDPGTQRSVEMLPEITFLLGDESKSSSGSLLNLLPEGTLFWHGQDEIQQRVERFYQRADEAHRHRHAREAVPPSSRSSKLDEIAAGAERLRQVIWKGPLNERDKQVDFGARHPDPFAAGFENLAGYLKRYLTRRLEVWVASDTEGERERLEELLSDAALEGVNTLSLSVSGGFISPTLGVALLASHELFARRRLRARHTRFRRRQVQFDRSALRRGDLVVHSEYGIGIYEGLQTIKVREQRRECLRIRYQDDDILYVRVENFGAVEKYVGSDTARPQLSRLGGREWERAKRRTRKALQDITAELTHLYARRRVISGREFPPDTHWQREMEASFEFDDTPDQVTTTSDVKRDLEDPHPMDRLLCGDVGFGKTEIAVRAAFKVVQESCQVGVLVPTTILAQQHLDTFRDRLASYPVKIEVLSRFRTPAEQKRIVKGLKDGSVDIVIGTHRLLSRDVEFKRLGLVVIDEEHRFGVRHKERLKQLKTNVDVLTLTATPIPRTLHLALMGARDTSQINTPPIDRLPVQTEVHHWSEGLIRDAIYREIDRQGQVFFVHNRVQSIHSVKGMLERLAPGLRYAVAHGQMPERQLERVMVDFLQRHYDVLVTTMIIESGLDIPNVNTLLVNRADRFGLAQLYQLRGRIGRSNRQAYAHFLIPPRMSMTPEARRRLATLAEMTELGSGLKVAMRDLEIRGAGNLLGPEQSGYINAVGFELYTRLLEEAVCRLKGEEIKAAPTEEEEVRVEFDGPALLPSGYIDDGDLRYEFYLRLARAGSTGEIDRLTEELTDRFGTPPDPARNLIELAKLKLLSREAGFQRVAVLKRRLTADLTLPPEPDLSQRIIGRLVAAADPEQVEFRMGDTVELIYHLNRGEPLERARKFLQRITRNGILVKR